MQDASEALVDFATGLSLDAVPEAVLHRSKMSILDAIGTALLSSELEKSRQTARAVRGISARGGSVAWGLGFRASPMEAALLNGMLVEGLDYSDIHVGAGLHPTSVILPAVVSCGESDGSRGDEVMLAHVVGCETMIRLGLTAPGRFHARGFQPTSIVGVLGAAVATSKLMKLGRKETGEALSLASTLAFGSSLSVRVGAYFGGVDSGRAAESGLLASLLAREGIAGIARDSIEGRFGFLETYAGQGNYDLRPVTQGLGKTWGMKEIFLKRYPTSYACTQLLDAALRLRKDSKIAPGDIAEVRFGASAPNIGLFSEPEEQKRRPATIYDAKTSHYFLLSLALARGSISAESLLANLRDASVLELSDRVSYELDEKSQWVEVKTRDGRVLRETEDALVPTRESAVRSKYRENSRRVIGEERTARVENSPNSR